MNRATAEWRGERLYHSKHMQVGDNIFIVWSDISQRVRLAPPPEECDCERVISRDFFARISNECCVHQTNYRRQSLGLPEQETRKNPLDVNALLCPGKK